MTMAMIALSMQDVAFDTIWVTKLGMDGDLSIELGDVLISQILIEV
jgi:hypothetical protein